LNEDKSTRYRRAQQTSFCIGLALLAAGMVVLLPGGGAIALRDAIVRATGTASTSLVTVVLFAAALVTLVEIVSIPVSLYQALLDRRYGLSWVPLSDHLRDFVKNLAIGTVLVCVAAVVVYLALARWPTWWWLVSAASGAVVMIVIARLVSMVIPIFFTCRPLDRPQLRARLERLSSRAGLDGISVYEWMREANSRRANAALAGTGRGRRVLLSDALLSDYSDDEIEVIVAHELGHHVHMDIFKTIALRSMILAIALAAAAAALNRFWQPLGLDGPNDAAGMPLLLLAGAVVVLVTQPLLHALSRRKEYRADRFALTLTGRADVFVTALRRLAAQNLVEARPSTLTLLLFHSHPPVEGRIQAARAFLS
jgi:STE24 endopeptidase